MRKLSILAAALLMGACTSQTPHVESFKLSVNLANADGQTLYLQRDGQVLDSAVIENWEAVFETPVRDDNEMYGIMMKGWRRPFLFFTDNKDVTLEGDSQNTSAIVVKGSDSQARLDEFTQGFVKLDAPIDSLASLLQKAKKDGATDEVDRLELKHADAQEIQKMYCFDFVWEHPTDLVAHYVLNRYKWLFGLCEIRTMIDNIYAADSTITSQNLETMVAYVEKQERVQAGQPIIDFTQNDVNGQPITLSKLAEGKLLLVDFWASWCPDCRKENPNVVAAYQRFHEQGLDVLGVSFDTDRERWLAAIEKDGLTWTHVSDLKGWGNEAGALYAVSFIPQNALIKDGVIVARNLEGEALMQEIEAQLRH